VQALFTTCPDDRLLIYHELRPENYHRYTMSIVGRGSKSAYDSGLQLLRDVWALTAVAIVAIFLRFIAKLRVGKFGPDDLIMGFALVSIPFSTS
jgi:hypothetical protein